jgi:hypothetical protein
MEKKYIYNFFKEKVSQMDIDEKTKCLILDKAFKDYSFYNYLPLNIYKLSKPNNEMLLKVAQLTLYSYLYFLVILYYDKITDKQGTGSISEKKGFSETMFFCINEYAVRGLSNLFPGDEFWQEFNQLKKAFFASSNIKPTHKNLLNVLTAKSVLAHAYVLSSKHLLREHDSIAYSEIIDALDHFHTGFQLQDDYEDIKEDVENNQTNYYIFKISSEYNITESKSDKYLQKLIYASGCAEEGLEKANKELEIAKSIFEKYGFADQIFNIDGILYKVRNELHYIRALMYKTRQKATLSHTFLANSSISEAINKTEEFISSKLCNDIWEDFLTNAGLGRNWITGYVISMMGELGGNTLPLDRILDNLLVSGGKYNENIVEDADSSNFLVNSLIVLGRDIPDSVINSWLKFQNKDKGFSTYYNNDIKKAMRMREDADFKGWFSSQNCVTAVACLAASQRLSDSSLKNIYRDTRDFLVEKQEKDGSWKSYWWTERIYSTCFSVMALYNDKDINAAICKNGIDYIISHQAENGNWCNQGQPCTFYTALALKTIMLCYQYSKDSILIPYIEKGMSWICKMQYDDGSWCSSRMLRLPFPDELEPENVKDWRNTSFGLNCLVDDHNRIFTSAMVYNTLKFYDRLFG